MPIELIVGPYRSGKTARLLRELLDYSRGHPFENTILVVPSARYRNLVEERLFELSLDGPEFDIEASPAGGYFGIRVMPFYQVCRLVLEAHGSSAIVIPDNIRALIVARVMESLRDKKKISALAPIAGFKGTGSALLNLIDEFQRAGLSPEEVLIKLEKTAAADSRLIDLASIYQAYWHDLQVLGYLDQHLLAFKARELLFGNPNSGLNLNWIIADGFDRFNRLQLQVLLGLSRHSKRTTITFDFVDKSLPYYESYMQDYLWKEYSYSQLLSILEPELTFVDPTEMPRECETFSALDRYMEMHEIARLCKQLIHDGNAEAGNLLVVARDLNAYRGAIDAAFGAAGLPYFVDESVKIKELPIVQYIRRLLHLSTDQFLRADVVACFRSPYFNLSSSGLTDHDIDEIDNLSIKKRLVGGISRWQSDVLVSVEERVKEKVIDFFSKVTPPQEIKSLTQMCVFTEDVLETFLVKLSTRSESHPALQHADAYQALAGVRNALRNLIEEENLLGPQLVSFESFLGKLDQLIEESNFRRSQASGEAIVICGAEFAPNRSFDAVFIAGLLEGEFPRRSGTSGFVSADELARWAGFGVEMHNPRHHPGFELALFRSLVDRAGKMVHMSFPRYEMTGGDELVPSFFVTGGDSEVQRSIPFRAPFAQAAVEPVSGREAFSGLLWSAPHSQPEPALLEHPELAKAWALIETPLTVARARAYQQREIAYNGWLVDPVATGALAVSLPGHWSVSALNDYGQCPFRFWASRILGLDRREEPVAGLDRLMRGQAYHKALELFFMKLAERGLSLRTAEDPARQEIFDRSMTEALEWLLGQPEFHPGSFWEYEKIELRFRLSRFLDKEKKRLLADPEPIEPSKFEVRFGFEEGLSQPPLKIDAGGQEVLIRGTVDRLDIREDSGGVHVRVIDYKTGSSPIPAQHAADGRNLQIPVYALAAERAILPGSRVVKGAYLSVMSGEPVGRFDFESAGDRGILAQAEHHIASFVDGVKRGVFTVKPQHSQVCQYCPHGKICRIKELQEDEEGDDATAD